jgi:hypothetical protein
MTADQGNSVNGALIRGADGAMYLVPDEDLVAFRLPDDQAVEVKEQIEGEVQGFLGLFNQPVLPVGDSSILLRGQSQPTIIIETFTG